MYCAVLCCTVLYDQLYCEQDMVRREKGEFNSISKVCETFLGFLGGVMKWYRTSILHLNAKWLHFIQASGYICVTSKSNGNANHGLGIARQAEDSKKSYRAQS